MYIDVYTHTHIEEALLAPPESTRSGPDREQAHSCHILPFQPIV